MAQTYTPPSVPLGSYAASVVYSKTLMARAITRKTFLNRITGPLNMDQWMQGLKQGETSHGYPVVQSTDLAKLAGDRVTCDILDRIGGKPVMGDKIARNSGVPISFERDEITIDQTRKVVDVGGRMSQQRTPHQLRDKGQQLAIDYITNLNDNVLITHLAGARGDAKGIDWKLPLASDPDFAEIMVNPVTPPTANRYVGLTGSITNPGQVSSTNTLTLNFFDDLRTISDTSEVPLQGVRLEGPNGDMIEGDESALLLCFISSEQWNQLQKDTSAQNWRTFMSNATERLSWTKHPLFRNGMCGLWRDILICQAPRPIQFSDGASVDYYDAAGAIQSATAAERLHRGVLLGAQAACHALGNAERWSGKDAGQHGRGRTDNTDIPYSWVEKLEDGDNLLQLFIGQMNGIKKLVYTFGDEAYDNGVFAFDSYVPALRS